MASGRRSALPPRPRPSGLRAPAGRARARSANGGGNLRQSPRLRLAARASDRANLPFACGVRLESAPLPCRSSSAAAPPTGRRGGVLVKTCFHWREESRKTVLRGQNRRSLEANRTVWPGNTPRRPPGRFGFPTKPLIIGTRLDAWSKPAFSVPTAKAGFDHGGRLPVSGAIDRTDLPDARGFGSGISSPQPAGAYLRERRGCTHIFQFVFKNCGLGRKQGALGASGGGSAPRAARSEGSERAFPQLTASPSGLPRSPRPRIRSQTAFFEQESRFFVRAGRAPDVTGAPGRAPAAGSPARRPRAPAGRMRVRPAASRTKPAPIAAGRERLQPACSSRMRHALNPWIQAICGGFVRRTRWS